MITYHDGDLIRSDCNIICHQTNCLGVMGAGIAKTIKETYPDVYDWFRDNYKKGNAVLGNIDFVHTYNDKFISEMNGNNSIYVPVDRFVVNMYAQQDCYPRTICHTNYEAFRTCCQKIKSRLKEVAKLFNKKESDYKIGFPYNIGCGLAGGDWNIVSKIIEEEFSDKKYNVEIWKLN